jgi:hypothetical protein
MSALADLVEGLKREVAVPGTFATVFPETTDDDLEEALKDAFAQAALDGFFASSTLDLDDGEVTPDLSLGASALVIIYAGIRFLTADLLNRKTHIRYEASGAVFEQDTGASLLVEALKGLRAKKDAMLAAVQAGQRAGIGITMVDGYVVKAVDFDRLEIGGPGAYGRVLGY